MITLIRGRESQKDSLIRVQPIDTQSNQTTIFMKYTAALEKLISIKLNPMETFQYSKTLGVFVLQKKNLSFLCFF